MVQDEAILVQGIPEIDISDCVNGVVYGFNFLLILIHYMCYGNVDWGFPIELWFEAWVCNLFLLVYNGIRRLMNPFTIKKMKHLMGEKGTVWPVIGMVDGRGNEIVPTFFNLHDAACLVKLVAVWYSLLSTCESARVLRYSISYVDHYFYGINIICEGETLDFEYSISRNVM